jgi:hypothetical protein
MYNTVNAEIKQLYTTVYYAVEALDVSAERLFKKTSKCATTSKVARHRLSSLFAYRSQNSIRLPYVMFDSNRLFTCATLPTSLLLTLLSSFILHVDLGSNAYT